LRSDEFLRKRKLHRFYSGKKHGGVNITCLIDNANANNYDALLLPGGVANPDQLRTNQKAVQFVKSFFEAGKPVAAICHGLWTLIEADAVKGRTVTSWPSLQTDLRNAGANWVDREVVVDNGLITSRNPNDIPAFCSKAIEEFAEGHHEQQPNPILVSLNSIRCVLINFNTIRIKIKKKNQALIEKMSQTPTNKRIGRPRSEESKTAILEATWKLLKTTTLRDLSIEAIARESGVGKTTIYRWWPNKVAVAIDAFLENVLPVTSFLNHLSATEAIAVQMASLVKAFSGEYGRIVAQIIAEGQACPEALASYRDRFLSQRRVEAKTIIQRGIENGEFDPTLDPELAMDILYGAIYFRLLISHLPLDRQFAEELPQWALKTLKI
jgi:PfpI family intracellular protease